MKENLFSINIKRKSNSSIDELLFLNIKNSILGKKYDLSVNFVGKIEIQKLNKKYRKKNYATDILSFPISKNVGEIFICIQKANQKSNKYERTKENFLKFLYIHGLVHLKGFKHGSRMDIEEEKFRKKFGI